MKKINKIQNKAVALYENGLSFKEISDEMSKEEKISPTDISFLVRMSTRTKIRKKETTKKKIQLPIEELIYKKKYENKSYDNLADEYGVSKYTVFYQMKEHFSKEKTREKGGNEKNVD